MSDFREQTTLTNVPLYAATAFLRDTLKKRQAEIDRLLSGLL